METNIESIKQDEIIQYKYITIPKEIFFNKKYKTLSSDAKILYGWLIDRLTLSLKNNWHDKDGNVYLIFTRKELHELLNISERTCTKVFKELTSVNLLYEKKRGKGLTKMLYPEKIKYSTKVTGKNCGSRNENISVQDTC